MYTMMYLMSCLFKSCPTRHPRQAPHKPSTPPDPRHNPDTNPTQSLAQTPEGNSSDTYSVKQYEHTISSTTSLAGCPTPTPFK